MVIMFLVNDSPYNINKKACLDYYCKDIKGVVIQKYRDKEKNILMFKLKDRNDTLTIDFIIVNEVSDINEVLNVGDYYHKPANSFKNYIHKKDTVIFRQGTSCFCGDSIPADCKGIVRYSKSWWDKLWD
jgi:hypothetical protein